MTDLEALVFAGYVFAHEYRVPARPGRPALVSNAELVALTVAQAAIGISTDRQFLVSVELPDHQGSPTARDPGVRALGGVSAASRRASQPSRARLRPWDAHVEQDATPRGPLGRRHRC